jgi:hypothetical protein
MASWWTLRLHYFQASLSWDPDTPRFLINTVNELNLICLVLMLGTHLIFNIRFCLKQIHFLHLTMLQVILWTTFRNSCYLWARSLISVLHIYSVFHFHFFIFCFCVLGTLSSVCLLLIHLVSWNVRLQVMTSILEFNSYFSV